MITNAPPHRHRNIVIMSDGTGNAASSPFKTNVWRLYQYLDLTDDTQLAAYDDGVGTDENFITKYLGLALGVGLERKVIDLYLFLSRNYRPGDHLFFFGFSRGAFTIRVLLGVIRRRGLLKIQEDEDKTDLRRKAREEFRLYRRHAFPNHKAPSLTLAARALGDLFRKCPSRAARPALAGRKVESVSFVGLWDTVDAYGVPIAELREGIDRTIIPLTIGSKDLWNKVERACHALSLDDSRETFHPLLWKEDPPKSSAKERITQVWFAGVHADVGGGYPDDRLSYIPLLWMMQEAEANGLHFSAGAIEDVKKLAWAKAPLHNPRAGLAAYYRFKPRTARRSANAEEREKTRIHESVYDRLRDEQFPYAPYSLPANQEIVYFDHIEGRTQVRESLTFELNREKVEHVLDLVWWRRFTYFATLFMTLAFAISPLFSVKDPETIKNFSWFAGYHRVVADWVRFVFDLFAGFLPDWVQPWVGVINRTPLLSLGFLVLFGAFWWVGGGLEERLDQAVIAAWRSRLEEHLDQAVIAAQRRKPGAPPSFALGRCLLDVSRFLRTNCIVTRIYDCVTKSFFPGVFAWSALLLGVYLLLVTPLNRNLFNYAAEIDNTFCAGSPAAAGSEFRKAFEIPASNPCGATGLQLEDGHRYLIRYRILDQQTPGWWRAAFLPLRRFLRFGWDDVIVQLDYLDSNGKRLQTRLEPSGGTALTATANGKLFVYRNNAVFAPFAAAIAEYFAGAAQPFYEADKSRIRLLVTDTTPADEELLNDRVHPRSD